MADRTQTHDSTMPRRQVFQNVHRGMTDDMRITNKRGHIKTYKPKKLWLLLNRNEIPEKPTPYRPTWYYMDKMERLHRIIIMEDGNHLSERENVTQRAQILQMQLHTVMDLRRKAREALGIRRTNDSFKIQISNPTVIKTSNIKHLGAEETLEVCAKRKLTTMKS